MKKVQACYEAFIQKWDPQMPAKYTSVNNLELPRLRALPDVSFDEFQPMVSLQDPMVEII
jgi:hypothetical protein